MNTNGKMINSNLDEMGYHGALYKKITKHYNITTILYVAVFLPYAIAMLISTSLTPGDGTTIAFFDALIIKTGVTFCGFMSCYKKNNVYVFCVLLLQLISLIICPTLGTFLDLLSLFGANKLLTVLAFVLGLGLCAVSGDKLKNGLIEFSDLINKVISGVIIPLLPLYVFGIFLQIGAEGQAGAIMKLFIKVIAIIFVLHVSLLLIQFIVTGAIVKKNPLKLLVNMLPAYMTALGTQSSAATIPVTLKQAIKNGVDEKLAGFVIPLCATIHLAGSTLKIVACAFAILWMQGMPHGLEMFAGFICMLGITMVAAPGVPGGAIMAALGLLASMLGFSEELQGLMIALYIAMDTFGTACNVTGDGAIALVVNKIYKK